MAIELTDDGTLDTVLRCSECGEEMRYNYANSCADDASDVGSRDDEKSYDEFIEECIEDATAMHECAADDDEPREPGEDDITTTDHLKFYQSGRLVIDADIKRNAFDPHRFFLNTSKGQRIAETDDYRAAVRVFMEIEQYWPNCWFISDHGNAHLIDLSEGK